MAARFRKPSSGKQIPITPRYNPEWVDYPVQGESVITPPEPKLSALDYIKLSPAIAKEVLPSLARESIDPIGTGSAESLANAISPELNRGMTQARTGQGFGRPTQLSGKVTLSPKLQMLSRLVGGAGDALANTNISSFFSGDTLAKGIKQGLGYGKDKVTKGDLAMLGAVYGTGPAIRSTKKGLKALKSILAGL